MKLENDQIEHKLINFPGWKLTNRQIEKTFTLKNSETALKLFDQINIVAENLQHHPEVKIFDNNVSFKLSTHSENGVTEKDFALAREIEQAYEVINA